MKRIPLVSALSLIVSTSTVAFSQAAAEPSSSAGLELLQQVAKRYADAKSYYIEASEERQSRSQYHRDSAQTFFIVAEAPGNRYHYEGRGWTGSALKISDGSKIWSYRIDARQYTVKPEAEAAATKPAAWDMSDQTRMEAEYARRHLADLAKNLKSAEMLADQSISANGHEVLCSVVRVQNSDQKRVRSVYRFDRTIYIDKASQNILRIAERSQSEMRSGAALIPVENETVTTYAIAELDQPVHDSLFIFTPPAEARLVADFPDPMDSNGGPNLRGEPVPPLKLKSGDGKVVSIESFRGKPVLIDFWATWCAPCISSLPRFAEIYRDSKDKGLVVLTVDQDEEAKNAVDLLAKKGYDWQNFHDGDGEIEKLMGSSGIPRAVLVNAQGQIVFDSVGPSEDRLRTEISKLGPEYASLAPKPKPAPCMATSGQ